MKEKVLSLFSPLTAIINRGHNRSVKAKKNILATFVLRGLSIGINLMLVPLTINYVNPSRYGIWLTLSSIIGWFSFFDIGLTQGLRNKFAEAKAKGEDDAAQMYVSTTYAVLAIIFGITWLLFVVVNNFLDWSSILKISTDMRGEVSLLAVIVFTYFCLQFVLKIITTIITADQQPARASLIDVSGQVLALLTVFVLVKTTQGSLTKLGLALCAAPILVLGSASVFLFRTRYFRFRPQLSKIDFRQAKSLFNLGIVFFIIQVAGVIQFETANIIIARNFSTADVTSYNIVYKYFGILSMLFSIFLVPFWSAATEAYLKNDIQWIRNSVNKYNKLNVALVVMGVVMLLCASTVYRLWLGDGKVNIDFSLSLWGFLFFNATMFGSKYVMFLNGISALRIQFLACLVSPFLYVLVSLILIRYYHMGVYALFAASIIANFNSIILAPLQYYQIIVRNKKGIWTR